MKELIAKIKALPDVEGERLVFRTKNEFGFTSTAKEWKVADLKALVTEYERLQEALEGTTANLNHALESDRRSIEELAESEAKYERLAAEFRKVPSLVPTNWLDPLLSGDQKTIHTSDYREIEALLRGVQDRLRAAVTAYLDGKEKQNEQ